MPAAVPCLKDLWKKAHLRHGPRCTERVLGADRLDLWYERTAQKQYNRDFLFFSVYDLMNQVVFCVQPSVRAAYQAHQNDVGTSLVSVYNKLNGLETHTAAELVRYSAREFAPLIQGWEENPENSITEPLARSMPECERLLFQGRDFYKRSKEGVVSAIKCGIQSDDMADNLTRESMMR